MNRGSSVWIGLVDQGKDGTRNWTWTDGLPFDYEKFDSGTLFSGSYRRVIQIDLTTCQEPSFVFISITVALGIMISVIYLEVTYASSTS